MKNYYEILEVDVKASKEMIDRAFKLLAKRYHPDTQEESKKAWAEEKFKEINSAYEVLSDLQKRKEYDIELDYQKNSEKEALLIENENLKHLISELKQELILKEKASTTQNTNRVEPSYAPPRYRPPVYHYEKEEEEEDDDNVPPSSYYQTNYARPDKNRLKDILALLLTLCCIIFIGFVLWKIPFTHDWSVDLYENNPVIHSITNFILSLFGKQ